MRASVHLLAYFNLPNNPAWGSNVSHQPQSMHNAVQGDALNGLTLYRTAQSNEPRGMIWDRVRMGVTSTPFCVCGPFLPGSCFSLTFKRTQTSTIPCSAVKFNEHVSVSILSIPKEKWSLLIILFLLQHFPCLMLRSFMVFLPASGHSVSSLPRRLICLYPITTQTSSFFCPHSSVLCPSLPPYTSIVMIARDLQIYICSLDLSWELRAYLLSQRHLKFSTSCSQTHTRSFQVS